MPAHQLRQPRQLLRRATHSRRCQKLRPRYCVKPAQRFPARRVHFQPQSRLHLTRYQQRTFTRHPRPVRPKLPHRPIAPATPLRQRRFQIVQHHQTARRRAQRQRRIAPLLRVQPRQIPRRPAAQPRQHRIGDRIHRRRAAEIEPQRSVKAQLRRFGVELRRDRRFAHPADARDARDRSRLQAIANRRRHRAGLLVRRGLRRLG